MSKCNSSDLSPYAAKRIMMQIGFKTNLTTMKFNSTIPRVSSALALALGAGVASAAPLSSDSFNSARYAVGKVAGQGTVDPFYSGNWATTGDNDVQYVASGLTWPGLQTSGGSLATGTIPAGNSVGRGGRNLATPWGAATE